MATPPPGITVPEGFTLHRENSAYLLLPSENGAFLNTIQEFNRDLSVACIRTWTERYAQEKATKANDRNKHHARKKRRLNNAEAKVADSTEPKESHETSAEPKLTETESQTPEPRPPRITVLEPLSATGLRAIRYCKEIPFVKHVIANDLSKDATIAMRRNVDINGLTPDTPPVEGDAAPVKRPQHDDRATILVNHGDASALMYTVKAQKKPIHVVDLDPYGTAAPFIDGAVQCVLDDGLLCVTCTDLAVLAGSNYPEKCFANYGGTPAKGEYCHEAALRLVLGSIATSAARYGRSITPLLSLSIDFYVRVFVQVKSSPVQVKKLSSQMATYYTCNFCQNFHEQPLGKVVEKISENGSVNMLYRAAAGPPSSGNSCEECGAPFHIAGPMWSAPIHDKTFVKEVLDFVNANADSFGTHTRMQGMLTVASEELDNTFYFTPSKIASSFHAEAPPLVDFASALLNSGYAVSRSHAVAGSIKTTAPRSAVHDIFRTWVKHHPVTMANIKNGSPSVKLLAKEASFEADYSRHPEALQSNIKLVRYQQNPVPNWGPATKASSKRKGGDSKDTQTETETETKDMAVE